MGARGLRLGVAGVMVGLAGLVGVSTGPAVQAEASRGEACGVNGDVGHDGSTDVVVGVPTADDAAGAVDVWSLEGTTTLTLASLGLPASSAGDRFGAAVAVDDVDCNGSADLVVGAPGVDGGRGRAYLVLDPLGVTQPPRVVVVGSGESAGAHFGAAVAAAGSSPQVRSSIQSDVWIGAPDTDLNDAYRQEGAVSHYVSRLDGQHHWSGMALVETFKPDTPGVESVLAEGHYGKALAASPGRVLIGAPDAGLRGAQQAGFVEERRSLDGEPAFEFSFLWNRSTPGVPGEPSTKDHFGASVASSGATSLIGAPGVDVGRAKDAGSVTVLADVGAWSLPDRTITYDSAGVSGTPKAGDRLGAAVALGESLGTACVGPWGLQAALGAPGRDVKSSGRTRSDAGAVVVVPTGTVDRGCRATSVLEQGHGLSGAAEAGDQVGATLGVLPYTMYGVSNGVGDRLLVGAPGEDWKGHKDAGIVQAGAGVAPEGSGGGLDARGIPTDHGLVTELTYSPGVAAAQRYGRGLAGQLGV